LINDQNNNNNNNNNNKNEKTNEEKIKQLNGLQFGKSLRKQLKSKFPKFIQYMSRHTDQTHYGTNFQKVTQS